MAAYHCLDEDVYVRTLHGSRMGPLLGADHDTVPHRHTMQALDQVPHAGVTLTVGQSVCRQLMVRPWSVTWGMVLDASPSRRGYVSSLVLSGLDLFLLEATDQRSRSAAICRWHSHDDYADHFGGGRWAGFATCSITIARHRRLEGVFPRGLGEP